MNTVFPINFVLCNRKVTVIIKIIQVRSKKSLKYKFASLYFKCNSQDIENRIGQFCPFKTFALKTRDTERKAISIQLILLSAN